MADTPPRTRRDANALATRQDLIAAARRVFAEKGFARAGIGELAEHAGVTTGALYHHFGNKKGLFRAVVEAIEAELLERSLARGSGASAGDPWAGFEAALEDTLDACQSPDVQRILVLDGPTVLSGAEWREIEEAYAFGIMRQALAGLIEAGVLVPGSAEMMARSLLSIVNELSRVVAAAPPAKRKQARSDASSLLSHFTGALRAESS